jgi:hypothetical protein
MIKVFNFFYLTQISYYQTIIINKNEEKFYKSSSFIRFRN